MNKLKKFTKAIGRIIRHPYLLNLVLQDEGSNKEDVIRKYGLSDGLPVIEINELFPNFDEIAKPYAYLSSSSLFRRVRGSNKPWYRSIPRQLIILTVIAPLAGLVLSSVFTLTKDIIADQKRAAQAASYQVVCPDADHFATDEALDKAVANLNGETYGTSFGRVKINEAFVAKDAEGNTTGYAISVTTADGYHGNITLAVGIHADDVVDGISFTELNETAGLGMRVDEDEF